jgi:transposase
MNYGYVRKYPFSQKRTLKNLERKRFKCNFLSNSFEEKTCVREKSTQMEQDVNNEHI